MLRNVLTVMLPFFLSSCSANPSFQCVDQALTLLQQSGVYFVNSEDEVAKEACEFVNMILSARTDASCKAREVYQYLADNTEYVVDNSVFRGFPDNEKKEVTIKLKRGSMYLVNKCMF